MKTETIFVVNKKLPTTLRNVNIQLKHLDIIKIIQSKGAPNKYNFKIN